MNRQCSIDWDKLREDRYKIIKVKYFRAYKKRPLKPPEFLLENSKNEMVCGIKDFTQIINKGVVVAVHDAETNEILIGWSMCHKSDAFNKKRGVQIAINRAAAWRKKNIVWIKSSSPILPMDSKFFYFVPETMAHFIKDFINWITSQYSGFDISPWAINLLFKDLDSDKPFYNRQNRVINPDFVEHQTEQCGP